MSMHDDEVSVEISLQHSCSVVAADEQVVDLEQLPEEEYNNDNGTILPEDGAVASSSSSNHKKKYAVAALALVAVTAVALGVGYGTSTSSNEKSAYVAQANDNFGVAGGSSSSSKSNKSSSSSYSGSAKSSKSSNKLPTPTKSPTKACPAPETPVDSIACSTLPCEIPGESVVTYDYPIGDDCVIADIDVTVTVENSFASKFGMKLESPNGQQAILLNDTSFDDCEDVTIIFDDESSNLLLPEVDVLDGTYQSQGPCQLRDMYGSRSGGNWTFTFIKEEGEPEERSIIFLELNITCEE